MPVTLLVPLLDNYWNMPQCGGVVFRVYLNRFSPLYYSVAPTLQRGVSGAQLLENLVTH